MQRMKKFFWISALCVGLSAAALFAAPVGAASADIRRGGVCGALREEAEIGRGEATALEVSQKEWAEVGLKDASASAAEPLAPACIRKTSPFFSPPSINKFRYAVANASGRAAASAMLQFSGTGMTMS